MNRKYNRALPVVALLLTGCQQPQQSAGPQPVKVSEVAVAQAAVGNVRSYSGTVEEASGTSLSFPLGGTVSRVLVEVGQRVGRGQLVATLDGTALQSAYTAARAALSQAEDAYRRMEQLHASGSLPEIQWVEAQTALSQAQSAEQIARKNLDDAKLLAPFAGVIAEKGVDDGENVMPGQAVVRLVDVARVKVAIAVPETEVAEVAVGSTVAIGVAALGGATFSGRIVEKGVAASPLTRSYCVKALVDNPGGALLPGMICDLVLDDDAQGCAVVVPANVVQLDHANRRFVWVDSGGHASRRYVTTGATTAGGVVIAGGLAPGDTLIVEGQQKVSEGTPVTTK